MNRLKLDNTGGLPFNQGILHFMQSSYDLLNAIGEVAGNLAILKGCQVVGSNVSEGVVYINGEVLYFKGGTLSENVTIVEEPQTLIFKDGVSKPVKLVRYAQFGGVANVHKWANFRRVPSLQYFDNKIFKEENSIEKRLKKLEQRVNKTIPIGLVAIWDRPADQIPEGWEEHTDLQGFTPVGQKLGDADFGRLGKTLGAKTHKLTINEMPIHNHQQGSEALYNKYGGGNKVGTRTYPYGEHESFYHQNTSKSGGDQPHNNIQPSRIVRFIRFVGFD